MYRLYDNISINEFFKTKDEAIQRITRFITETGFKSYYFKWTAITETLFQIDYGSHTHFFYFEIIEEELDISTKEIKKQIQKLSEIHLYWVEKDNKTDFEKGFVRGLKYAINFLENLK